MKIGNVAIVGTAMVAAIIAAAYWSANKPKPTTEVRLLDRNGEITKTILPVETSHDAAQQSKTTLDAFMDQWKDTLRLAGSTPRIQLAPIVSDMQKQSRDLKEASAKLPPC